MIKIVNTTEEYEGHDKYIYLELENTGKTLLLKYGGYINIEYNRESNEITFDLDAFREFIENLIEELKEETGHAGCNDCKYETYPENYYPCCDCKHNYVDKWQMKEGEGNDK